MQIIRSNQFSKTTVKMQVLCLELCCDIVNVRDGEVLEPWAEIHKKCSGAFFPRLCHSVLATAVSQ